MILPGGIIGGLPKVKAVTFDGTNDWLSKATDLTGVSDAGVGTLSMWIDINGNDSGTSFFVEIANLDIFRIGTGAGAAAQRQKLRIGGASSGGSSRINYIGGIDLTLAAGWVNILASWDANGTTEVYVDDVFDSAPVTNTNTAGTIDYTGTSAIGSIYIGSAHFHGDMAELWIDFATKIDFTTEANRRKFITGSGRPVPLGASGERPTGSSPTIYLKGPASNWGTNAGTGGNFTVNGTFTDASTSPSD